LKSVELVLVEHVDEVLRKALVLDDPEHFLMPRPAKIEVPELEVTSDVMAAS
jgi:hypothetical protein